nr:MAG TPA: Major capsid protein [Caudoviricetes sp.]
MKTNVHGGGVSAQNNTMYLKRITDSIEKTQKNSTTNSYFKVATENMSVYDKGVVAEILNNHRQIMDSEPAQNMIKTQNYGPFVPELWPIVAAWYPDFPLRELICVQGMTQPLAYLVFSRLLAGTSKAETVAGEQVETPTGLRTIHGSYPTGEVHGEQVQAADFTWDGTDKTATAALVYFPLFTGADYLGKFMINITSTQTQFSGKYVADAVNGDTITFKTDNANKYEITMDIPTGGLTIKQTSASANEVTLASVYYVWDIQTADKDNIPSLVEDLERIAIEAKPRALGLRWSVFAEYEKKTQFGADIRTDTSKRVLNLLYQYQVRYILDVMYNFATGTEATITIPTSNITVESKAQEVLQLLNAQAQVIAQTTGRMYGNRLVVGRTFRSWLESLPSTYVEMYDYDEDGYESPRKLCKFGQYIVFYDPHMADDAGFMTYRGNFWADASYYVGEYMPVTPTDAVAIGVEVRSAFCSMEAHLYHKPNAVIPLKFA